MKKRILMMLVVLLFSTVVFAQPLDWFKAEKVTTELNVGSRIDIEKTEHSGFVKELKAEVIFVPKNTETTAIRSFETKPPAVVTGEKVTYTWENPQDSVNFSYNTVVERINTAPRVTTKIPFPAEFPKELEEYTKATEHIDSKDPAIIGQATYITQEEDDLFEAVSKMAIWTKSNIQYNLSTLTAEISQPASWVLENKKGVCDEITSLFIAMLRSKGIPAKFISGIAFTSSSQFPQGWGAHGWAEVYFPGTGWVPFDPTFGEFGWVDPGHIKLKESITPKEPTTVYEWQAKGADVKVHDLEISAVKLSAEGEIQTPIKFTVKPLRERVGFGSYNGIMLEVQNLADFYVVPEFALAQVKDMEIISDAHQQVIIPPGSRRRVFWKVKTAENLDPKFQYEIPVHIYTVKNETADNIFHVGKWDVVFSEMDITSQIENQNLLSAEPFEIACQPREDRTYEENTVIACKLQNKKSDKIEIEVCQEHKCRSEEIQPGQTIPVTFPYALPKPGNYEVKITAATEKLEKKAVMTVTRLDEPKIEIKNMRIPSKVNFGDEFQIQFQLSRQSITIPKNVNVEVTGPGVESKIKVGNLNADQDITINVESKELFSSRPRFKIRTTYEDRGKYQTSQEAIVKVVDMPWWRKAIGFFMNIF